MTAKILVIDDDRRITALLRRTLVFEGYEVQVAGGGEEGLRLAASWLPDLVLLDVLMPGLDGWEVCRRLRAAGGVPVLMLTARDDVSDRVKGLDLGADDYLVKPFALEELLARVRALLRRKKPGEPVLQPLVYEDLVLDHTSREVRRGDRLIQLTAREFDLLALLLENPRQVLTRDLIMERVWGYDFSGESNVLEVYIGMLRQKLEEAWRPEFTRARYLFTWSHRADGTPDKQYPMEKIHRRHGFRWVHPVHEVLEYSGTEPDSTVWVDGLILHHYPDLSKPRSQYLPLLELSVRENPDDDRAVFWLGREYMYYGKWSSCIETLKRHLALPSAKWDEERAASMRFIARCHEMQGDFKQAKAWLFRAAAECPGAREPYLALAKLAYREENWPMLYAMAKNGLAIAAGSGSYLVEPESWGPALWDYGAIGAYRLGLFKEAHDLARRAVELGGGDERLAANLKRIEQRLAGEVQT